MSGGKILTICGSMQFFRQMEDLKSVLESKDFFVYLPEAEESEDFYAQLSEKDKPALKRGFIDAHLEKIKRSTSILVANYPKNGISGYVGSNTLMEIAFAYALEKNIYLLNPLGDQPCKDELLALELKVVDPEFSQIRS